MNLRLTVIDHDNGRRPYPAGVGTSQDSLTIGRLPGNDLVLEDDDVSRWHAQIHRRGEHFVIVDENSANGVFLNGSSQEIPKNTPQRLHDGDRLRIGDYTLEVSIKADGDPEFGESPDRPAESRESTDAHVYPDLDGPHHVSKVFGNDPIDGPAQVPELDEIFRNTFEISKPVDNGVKENDPMTPESIIESRGKRRDRSAGQHRPEPDGPRHFQQGIRRGTSSNSAPPSRHASHPPEREIYPPPEPPADCGWGDGPDSGSHLRSGDSMSQGARRGTSSDAQTQSTRNDTVEIMIDSSGEAIRSFFAGLEIDIEEIPRERLEAVSHEAGRLLRTMSSELMRVLDGRRDAKRDFGVDLTQIERRGNNPLKTCADTDTALRELLIDKRRGNKCAQASAEESFRDLHTHHMAMIAGLRAALHSLVAGFHPRTLERRFERRSLLDGVLPSHRKARCWDLFVGKYEDVAVDAAKDFRRLFRTEFQSAYEEQVENLKRESELRTNTEGTE